MQLTVKNIAKDVQWEVQFRQWMVDMAVNGANFTDTPFIKRLGDKYQLQYQ